MEIQNRDLDALLEEMFEEKTGRHMLDSGGAYGRHWEANQNGAYKNRKPVTLGAKPGPAGEGEIFGVISTYHAMKEYLDVIPPALGDRINQFYNLHPDGEFRKDFPEFMYSNYRARIGDGLGGEGIMGLNTYNSSYARINQELQMDIFSISGDPRIDPSETFARVQLHNGCDVRSGYTRPRFFRLGGGARRFQSGIEEFSISDGNGNRWDVRPMGDIEPIGDTTKSLEEYPVISTEILTGEAQSEHFSPDPEAKELRDTIETWTRKVNNHSGWLSDELIAQHEESVAQFRNQLMGRFQSVAAEGNVVFIPSNDSDGAVLFSPVGGLELTAYL